MINNVMAYWSALSLGQKATLVALAGSASTLMGGAAAYKISPDFARMIDDNRNIALAATAILAAPVVLPLAANAASYATSMVDGIIPDFMKLPAFNTNTAVAGIHMNGLHMGSIAMRNNPLVVRNPIAMGAVHAMNGLVM